MFRFRVQSTWYDPEGYYISKLGNAVTVIAENKSEAIDKAALALGDERWTGRRRRLEVVGDIEEIACDDKLALAEDQP